MQYDDIVSHFDSFEKDFGITSRNVTSNQRQVSISIHCPTPQPTTLASSSSLLSYSSDGINIDDLVQHYSWEEVNYQQVSGSGNGISEHGKVVSYPSQSFEKSHSTERRRLSLQL